MRVDRAQGGRVGTRRSLAVGGALLVVVATTACGSGSGPAAGGTTTPPPMLLPFTGAFATVALPPGIQALQDVDCPSTSRCWAVGSTLGTAKAPSTAAIVTTSTGGTTWTVQSVPSTVGYLTGIACPTTKACTAVGQIGTDGTGPGAVLTTADSGGTWTLQTVPTGTTDATAVACPTVEDCMVLADVAGQVTTLTAGGSGASWVAGGALPATVASATDLSCTDADDCWATVASPVGLGHVAGGVAATVDGGATWAMQALPAGTGALQGIDCVPGAASATTTTSVSTPVRADCTAVGTTATVTGATRVGEGLVLTTTTGGATWAQASVTPNSADLLAVSCGAGPCVAVGTTVSTVPTAGLVVLTGSAPAGPSTWRRAETADVPLPLTGVSCRSLSACVVVGETVSAHLSAA